MHETIFVLNTGPGDDGLVDLLGVNQIVKLRSGGSEPVVMVTYTYAVLRGETDYDVVAKYDGRLGALIAWNASKPNQCRIFGCSIKPESNEISLDYAKAISGHCPGPLSGKTEASLDPLGVLQHSVHLKPGASVSQPSSWSADCQSGSSARASPFSSSNRRSNGPRVGVSCR